MRPIRLYLKNFRNYKEAQLNFDGLNSILILGRNKDNDRVSNGVGKTTIFNGIEYVLFNELMNGTLNQVIKDGEKKAIVEYEFEISSGIYKVYRHRTASSADLRIYKKEGDEWEAISKRTPSETEEELKNIIKISHKAFVYSVLFRQADLAGISDEANSKSRIKILKEPLNLSKYTKLEKIAGEKIKPIKAEIDRLENSLLMLGNPQEDIIKTEQELEENKVVTIQTSAVLDLNLSKILQKESSISDLKASLGKEDTDIHDKIAIKEKEINDLKNANVKENRKLDKENEQISELKSKISSLNANYLSYLDRALVLENKIEPEDSVKKDLDKVRTDETKGMDLVAGLKAEINHIKISVPDESICPLCAQSITDDYRHHFEEEAKAKFDAKNKDLEFYQEALKKCRAKKQKLETKLNEIRILNQEIKTLKQNIENCENNIKTNKEYLERTEIRIKDIQKTISDNNSTLGNFLTLLVSLQETARESNASELNNKIFTINNEIKDLKNIVEQTRKELANLSSKEGALKERIKLKEEDKIKIVNFKDELKKANKKYQAYNKGLFAFSYKGIPTYKIRNILSELQFETNKVLKQLRPELEVQLDAELNIEYRRNGNVRDYSQLSYGQKVYIALAFKRSLSRVIQNRLGINLNMVLFDEIDSNLDDAGRDAFKDAVNKWKADSLIFTITHNKELKDNFTHAILVEEDDKGSTANIVNAW